MLLFELPIVSWLVWLPTLGAIIIAGVCQREQWHCLARPLALVISLLTLVLSIAIYTPSLPFRFGGESNEYMGWLEWLKVDYHLVIDGISLPFIWLTTIIFPIALLASWQEIKERIIGYVGAFLILESCVLGVFCANNLLMFFLFFEATLIPMFFIIGVWGGEHRIYAAFKFFLYTFAGSIFFLISIIVIYHHYGSLEFNVLSASLPLAPFETQFWLWLGFFTAFAVKIPMWPLHTWLPDAHVQAPTGGSVVLAGILLKLGGYGLLRLSLPLLPDASAFMAPLMIGLSIVAVIYGSYVAFAQEDIKKLIAYSSVAHMGFVTAGLFSNQVEGIDGAIVQMISHGFVSSALFACVGVLYYRLHTRALADFGGVTAVMPRFATYMLFFTLASVGMPGTSGFIGEFLTMLGTFHYHPIAAFLLALGMVLGATYMLLLYKRAFFGPIHSEAVAGLKDLSFREKIMFLPLIGGTLLLGIYPTCLTQLYQSEIPLFLTR